MLIINSNFPLIFYFIFPLPFPYLILTAGLVLSTFFYQELNERIEMKSKVRFGSTYQAIALNFLFLTHGLFLLMISGGNLLWGILPSLGASLAFLIPAILMFIRIDVFDDSSVYLNEKSIIGIGFNPTLYYFISLAIGLYGYFNGFKSNNLIWILVVFLFQLLLAFPDKVNKYVPFEVKTKNGC